MATAAACGGHFAGHAGPGQLRGGVHKELLRGDILQQRLEVLRPHAGQAWCARAARISQRGRHGFWRQGDGLGWRVREGVRRDGLAWDGKPAR